MLAALASLSPEHRAVIVLRYLLEYSPGEIARALDLPRGTVNSRLRRGLDTLEIRLKELDTLTSRVKKQLREFRAPDETGAESRAWEVVRSAYLEREQVAARHRPRWRLAVAPAAAVIIAALALSPAGASVGRFITRALGEQHAAPALFSLPSSGRILVSGPGGTWTAAADGSTRRLGPWSQASWSPHGLFVAVASGDRLAAVDPHGTVRWALARPAVSDPSWYSPSGYRVAYLSAGTLRVLAGDGTGDRLARNRGRACRAGVAAGRRRRPVRVGVRDRARPGGRPRR